MLDASLCNVVGSPMSPPDGQWADLQPGMQGSVNSRPEPRLATGAAQARPSPADEAILRANQALSTRVCPHVPCSWYVRAVGMCLDALLTSPTGK